MTITRTPAPTRQAHEQSMAVVRTALGRIGRYVFIGFVLVFFFAINTYYLVLTVTGFWQTLKVFKEVRRPDQRRLLRSPLTPPISVLAPAFNEESNVVENVRSLLMLDYPLFEVILVNDGSKDRTLGRLVDAFDLRRSALLQCRRHRERHLA
jgi:poly-beta-1,6-N-acetyl-D-glucosamine synthase